jgi:predicted nucleotidyltransferase
MNLEQLRKSGNIIFECIAGSRCYGTHTEESDTDIRGVYILPNEDYLGLRNPPEQISDEKNDITFYSLKRFIELATPANPNIIELLFVPEECIIQCHPIMRKLIDNRHLFISTKAYHTFSGYAFAQVNRARGMNKRINSPLSKGLTKLINLYKQNKITKEWLESRFCRQVVEEVLKKDKF